MLTAVIITRDEADRIEDALRSVAFADERLVLDSGSTDATVALAEALGARVLRTAGGQQQVLQMAIADAENVGYDAVAGCRMVGQSAAVAGAAATHHCS